MAYQITDAELEYYLPKARDLITAIRFRHVTKNSYVVTVITGPDEGIYYMTQLTGVWEVSWLRKLIDYFTERGFEWTETT